MKKIFNIYIVLTFLTLSCSNDQAENRSKILISDYSFFGTNDFPGGAIFGGQSQQTFFNTAVLNNLNNTALVNGGTWSLFALGWDGANPLTGNVYCGKLDNLLISGGRIYEPQITLTQNNCIANSFFGGSLTKPVEITNCLELTINGVCQQTGFANSYKIILSDFKDESSIVLPSVAANGISSACYNHFSNNIPLVTDVKIPIGQGTNNPFRFVVASYENSDCGGFPTFFNFLNTTSETTSAKINNATNLSLSLANRPRVKWNETIPSLLNQNGTFSEIKKAILDLNVSNSIQPSVAFFSNSVFQNSESFFLGTNGKFYILPYIVDNNSFNFVEFDPLTQATFNGPTITSSPLFLATPPENHAWDSAVLANNGIYYANPVWSKYILKITINNTNPTTISTDFILLSTPQPSYSSDVLLRKEWARGVKATNGKIYYVPKYGSIIKVFNPADNSQENLSINNPTGWNQGVLAPNGIIYAPPTRGNTILKINPIENNMKSTININDPSIFPTPAGGLTTNYHTKFNSGAVGLDGKIYFCPAQASSVLVINPENDMISKIDLIDGNGQQIGVSPDYNFNEVVKWSRTILGVDGRIYCFPQEANELVAIDTSTPIPTVEVVMDSVNLGGTNECVNANGTCISSILSDNNGDIWAIGKGGNNNFLKVIMNPSQSIKFNPNIMLTPFINR